MSTLFRPFSSDSQIRIKSALSLESPPGASWLNVIIRKIYTGWVYSPNWAPHSSALGRNWGIAEELIIYQSGMRNGGFARPLHDVAGYSMLKPYLQCEHRPIREKITQSNLQYQGGIDFLGVPSS